MLTVQRCVGASTGVLELRVRGTTRIAGGGAIELSGCGFRGGRADRVKLYDERPVPVSAQSTETVWAERGEGMSGSRNPGRGPDANGSGGGGGGRSRYFGSTGGGGGGHAELGQPGAPSFFRLGATQDEGWPYPTGAGGVAACLSSEAESGWPGGSGGAKVGGFRVDPPTLGGGGGAGQGYDGNNWHQRGGSGGDGGAGGGALLLVGRELVVESGGRICADGQVGYAGSGTFGSGGGGGAGGSLLLVVGTLAVSGGGQITCNGGEGGHPAALQQSARENLATKGGRGAPGRLHFFFSAGAISPAACVVPPPLLTDRFGSHTGHASSHDEASTHALHQHGMTTPTRRETEYYDDTAALPATQRPLFTCETYTEVPLVRSKLEQLEPDGIDTGMAHGCSDFEDALD
eukprot:SAG31_NODE_1555_length_7895_cov_46.107748_4_plen_404_part_00